ncbi:MAG: hypothetical protein DPW12_07585 [Rhodocyclaceae bacterium]|nr:hypothetical protein [Bacteroidia bacterium]MCQ3924050.1 hypothetical protein [Rhodocyclaceae bacterium]
MSKTISISKFIRAIRQLPSDEPRVWPRAWYQTQKQHWLGWLGEYHGPGFYGRKTGIRRDAAYAYNHIVNHHMLLWLMEATGVHSNLVEAAKRAARRGKTMQAKSAAIRRHVGWEVIEARLWGSKRIAGKTRSPAQRKQAEMLVMNIERKYFAEILAIPRRKPVEYRELKDFWLRRLERVGPAPFDLRLLNGMLPPVPEAVVRVSKVVINGKTNEIELHLGKVLRVKHWDRIKEKPTR